MGPSYLPIKDLPPDNSIVWCKWPFKARPGDVIVSRPVLVRQTGVNRDVDGTEYGIVIAAYGTGEIWQADPALDLIFSGMNEARNLGLKKPTAFILSVEREKVLIWCEERFVPPAYVLNTDLVVGELDLVQVSRLRAKLAARGR